MSRSIRASNWFRKVRTVLVWNWRTTVAMPRSKMAWVWWQFPQVVQLLEFSSMVKFQEQPFVRFMSIWWNFFHNVFSSNLRKHSWITTGACNEFRFSCVLRHLNQSSHCIFWVIVTYSLKRVLNNAKIYFPIIAQKIKYLLPFFFILLKASKLLELFYNCPFYVTTVPMLRKMLRISNNTVSYYPIPVVIRNRIITSRNLLINMYLH